MQDPRMRIGATILLSFAAFSGVFQAVCVFLWWILFTPKRKFLQNFRLIGGAIAVVTAAAVITTLSGGDGISYAVRMTPVLLIAFWAFLERKSGEFIDVSVWALGEKRGFDLGLIAEMSLSSLRMIEEDICRVRIALHLKETRGRLRFLITAGSFILNEYLHRAEEQSRILAVRGYAGGGFSRPEFRSTKKDTCVFISALLLSTASFVLFVNFL